MDLKTVFAALNETQRNQIASYVDNNRKVSKPVAVTGWYRCKPCTWTAWVIPTDWHSGRSMFIILAKPGRGRVRSVESIRRNVAKRRAAKAAKNARRRNRR